MKRKQPKQRRKRKPTVNPRSARTMLDTLKSFAPDFAAVTITQGELTIAVTFNGPKPTEEQKRAQGKAEPPQKRRPTAIDSLNKTAPPFEFEGN